MALMNCPECGNEISDTAKVCVHCGYRIKKKKEKNSNTNKNRVVILLIILFLLAFGVGGYYGPKYNNKIYNEYHLKSLLEKDTEAQIKTYLDNHYDEEYLSSTLWTISFKRTHLDGIWSKPYINYNPVCTLNVGFHFQKWDPLKKYKIKKVREHFEEYLKEQDVEIIDSYENEYIVNKLYSFPDTRELRLEVGENYILISKEIEIFEGTRERKILHLD